MPGHVEVIRRRRLKQQWYAKFVADNNEPLSRTTEHYYNQADLLSMLQKYFPGWDVKVKD